MHYVFEGRLKDNINRGGEKFGAEEVETLITEHPAVNDARVVAMPDAFIGERACCFLIPKPGHQAPTVAELASFLHNRGLAKFKLPERIEVLDQFPVTRVGKVAKDALRKMIANKLEEEAVALRQQRRLREDDFRAQAPTVAEPCARKPCFRDGGEHDAAQVIIDTSQRGMSRS